MCSLFTEKQPTIETLTRQRDDLLAALEAVRRYPGIVEYVGTIIIGHVDAAIASVRKPK